MDYDTDTARRFARHMRKIDDAKAAVRSHVGDVIACDSAEAVYLAALRRLGHQTDDLKGLGEATARIAFDAAKQRRPRPPAMDARQIADREARFPDANRLNKF